MIHHKRQRGISLIWILAALAVVALLFIAAKKYLATTEGDEKKIIKQIEEHGININTKISPGPRGNPAEKA